MTNPVSQLFTRSWLKRGWWELRCNCGCGSKRTAVGLVVVRMLAHQFNPTCNYTVVRYGSMAEHWRERARFRVKKTWGGRVQVRRIPRVQH